MRLHGKTALVTGAAHGIGQAIAQVFAQEGAVVWLADLDAVAGSQAAMDICQSGHVASFIPCDVGSPEQVSAAVEQASSKSGCIDILCNNAAYISGWHNSTEASDDEWDN